MNRITITTEGFSIHDADERVLHHVEHIEQALAYMRLNDAAEFVRRVRDDEEVARKYRQRRGARFTLGRLAS